MILFFRFLQRVSSRLGWTGLGCSSKLQLHNIVQVLIVLIIVKGTEGASVRIRSIEILILQGNLWPVGKHPLWFSATFAKTFFAHPCGQTFGFEIPGGDFRNYNVDASNMVMHIMLMRVIW